jgi:hypothetical protein
MNETMFGAGLCLDPFQCLQTEEKDIQIQDRGSGGVLIYT